MYKFIPLTLEGEEFEIADTQVTFDEYDAFCTATNRKAADDNGWGRGTRPVINISWHDAVAYCEWRSSQDPGYNYRLPTEAEWEFACRAGSETAYCFGDNIEQLDDYAWYSQNAKSMTHPVGQKKPNNFGLYDMHGNVWEWTSSEWKGDEDE